MEDILNYLKHIEYLKYDKINYSGHLCFLKNEKRINELFMEEIEGTTNYIDMLTNIILHLMKLTLIRKHYQKVAKCMTESFRWI